MDVIVITGGRGFIGSKLIEECLANGLAVISLVRSSAENLQGPKQGFYELALLSDEADAKYVADQINRIGLTGRKVFCHLAWKGEGSLVSGSLVSQLSNVVLSSFAIEIAQLLGVELFINLGSQEEVYAKRVSEALTFFPQDKQTRALIDYGSAKLASYELGKLECYLKKINYVNLRISVAFDPLLKCNSYVHDSIRKLLAKEVIAPPKSQELRDITLVSDIAKSILAVCQTAHLKDCYYLGAGNPKLLIEHFCDFVPCARALFQKEIDACKNNTSLLKPDDFDVSTFTADVGFVCQRV